MGLCEALSPGLTYIISLGTYTLWLHLLLVSFFTEESGALLPGRAGRELGGTYNALGCDLAKRVQHREEKEQQGS